MSDHILLIGFRCPPCAVSSGYLRLASLTQYLPEHGWHPIVLSASQRAYEQVDLSSIETMAPGTPITRAFALDAKRHFGFRGKYLSMLARPDRWTSWRLAAVWHGLSLIRRYRISAIWSTYPIMSAHCIGHALCRMTGLPWIADFRDPVDVSVANMDQRTVNAQMRWERRVLARADRTVLTTPGALRSYADRFPEAARSGRLSVIPNGYDESSLDHLPRQPARENRHRLRLVHSGLLYPDGRNPIPFFAALAKLQAAGTVTSADVEIVLRASGSETQYVGQIEKYRLGSMVTLAPRVSNHDALLEQASADALLLWQGERFDRQIPAKVYEYLRIGYPIFALVGPNGDTATLLQQTGGAELVPMVDAAAIQSAFPAFLEKVRAGNVPPPDPVIVSSYSRRHSAILLADLLTDVIKERDMS